MRIPIHILAMLIISTFLVGCSGGQLILPDLTGADDHSLASDNPDNSAYLGIYQININTNDMTSSIDPIRSSGSADVLEAVDISGFMTSSPCRDCVRITGLGINSSNQLVVSVGIKHPFDSGDPGKPITGKNRADLHVFNVEGIIVTDQPMLTSFPGAGIDIANGYLVNPDGYTAYLDNMIDNIVPTESDAHPYKLFFNDYSMGNFDPMSPTGFTDPLNPSGNLVMKMGSGYSIKDYVFDVPAGTNLQFAFAVGCTYGFTTSDYTARFNPEYRIPQHNKKAASEVSVVVIENNLEQGLLTSDATLQINVKDINATAPTGTALNEMLFESDVASISVEIPSLAKEQLYNPTPLSGDGRDTPLVFNMTITNEYNAPAGLNYGLVKVTDSYPARQNPNLALGQADGLGRIDPQTTSLFHMLEFATYQVFSVNVEPCTTVTLRADPKDLGVDANGNILVGYGDNQVWKYDINYCTGEFIGMAEHSDSGYIMCLDVHEDGRFVVVSDGCT